MGGTFSQSGGFLMFNEICLHVQNNGWTNVVDVTGKMGPYAYSGNQWVGYDDVDMVAIKAQYILQNQLGGGMFWDLPSDDFKNVCGGGKYPLIRTLSDSLFSNCGTEIKTSSASSSVTTTASIPTTSTSG